MTHHFAAHRTFTRGSVLPKVSILRRQGYVYVPRKGIVDEARNLPTRACPNEMREAQ